MRGSFAVLHVLAARNYASILCAGALCTAHWQCTTLQHLKFLGEARNHTEVEAWISWGLLNFTVPAQSYRHFGWIAAELLRFAANSVWRRARP